MSELFIEVTQKFAITVLAKGCQTTIDITATYMSEQSRRNFRSNTKSCLYTCVLVMSCRRYFIFTAYGTATVYMQHMYSFHLGFHIKRLKGLKFSSSRSLQYVQYTTGCGGGGGVLKYRPTLKIISLKRQLLVPIWHGHWKGIRNILNLNSYFNQNLFKYQLYIWKRGTFLKGKFKNK